MRISLETSDLMHLKLKEKVSETRITELTKHLEDRDFGAFAELTMKESNSLHAICLDTYPPIFYMNETSRLIIKACTVLNHDGPKVAYSIDAGFHVFLFTLAPEAVLAAVQGLPGLETIIPTRIGRDGVKLL